MYPGAGQLVSRLLMPFGSAAEENQTEVVRNASTADATTISRGIATMDTEAGQSDTAMESTSSTTIPSPIASSSNAPPSPHSPISPQTQHVLSHLTRHKLQRAAAGHMAGGRGAPSLRQLVLWTNALVGPSIGGSSGWDDEEEEEGEEEERKRQEQEWFEGLMEEMVGLDDEDEDDYEQDLEGDEAQPMPRPPSGPSALSREHSAESTVDEEPREDERYVNILYKDRGRRSGTDSGYLETNASPLSSAPISTPPPIEFGASDDAGEQPAFSPSRMPTPRSTSPPQSALSAQLRRPEEVPLPLSPAPSPERPSRPMTIVRDLAQPLATDSTSQIDSWSSLIECEEVTLGASALSDSEDSPSGVVEWTVEEEERRGRQRGSMSFAPSSWGSFEVPSLTPDSSPPGMGFSLVGTESEMVELERGEDEEEDEEECGWHRMLRSRRTTGIAGQPDAHSAANATNSFGNWLGSAPFASEENLLLSLPGLETMELGSGIEEEVRTHGRQEEEMDLRERLRLYSASTCSTGGSATTRELGNESSESSNGSTKRGKRSLPPTEPMLAQSPPKSAFFVPPAPPPPPLPASVQRSLIIRSTAVLPWATPRSVTSSSSHAAAAVPIPHSIWAPTGSTQTPSTSQERATSPGRWSQMVRSFYDCVDLGICANTGLAPFGTVEAVGREEEHADAVAVGARLRRDLGRREREEGKGRSRLGIREEVEVE